MEPTMGSPVKFQPPAYPMAQAMPAQAQSPMPSASAVSINIIEPKAYAGPPPAQAPMVQPYNCPVAPVYNYAPAPYYEMPQAPIYGPQPSMYTPPVFAPIPMPQAQAPQPVTEAPVPPPPSVVDQQPAPAQVDNKAVQEKPADQLDVAALNKSLASANLDEQTAAIEKIAEIGQSNTPQAMALINEEVFKNLTSIISKDSTTLPEADKSKADGNKIIGMWTMAVLQKNLRDAVNTELKAQNQPPVPLYELPGMPQIEKNIKSDPNPQVKSAGIQALRYLAQPEDNQVISNILNTVVQTEKDPNVKADAQNALGAIPKAAPQPAAAPTQPAAQPEQKAPAK